MHFTAKRESVSLPIARYQFQFKVTEAFIMPAYSGSLLRGIFGHALREVTCFTKAESCEGCALIQSCAYKAIFEAPAPTRNSKGSMRARDVPQRYIIEPPEIGEKYYKPGDLLCFEMVLLGEARERLPLIIFAWERAFANYLKPRGKAVLYDVLLESIKEERGSSSSILDNGKVLTHTTILELPESGEGSALLHFTTPLRLQRNGQIIPPEKVNAETFLTQLARRILWLNALYFNGVLSFEYEEIKVLTKEVESIPSLFWYDSKRYSTRQKRKTYLGGNLGSWEFKKLPLSIYQLLYLGQWLHIGKNTTFGLGRYTLEK